MTTPDSSDTYRPSVASEAWARAEEFEAFADQHDWTVRTALRAYVTDMRRTAESLQAEHPQVARGFFESAEKAEKASEAWTELMDGSDDSDHG